MISLYESILSSTKTGKAKYPVWSKLYHHDEWEQAAKDYCKFYEIGRRIIKKEIKDLFLDFVQKDRVESFRFVQDIWIEEKMAENTNYPLVELKDKKAFFINGMNIYLIIKVEDDGCNINTGCWFWQNNDQIWAKVYYSPLSKYLLA